MGGLQPRHTSHARCPAMASTCRSTRLDFLRPDRMRGGARTRIADCSPYFRSKYRTPSYGSQLDGCILGPMFGLHCRYLPLTGIAHDAMVRIGGRRVCGGTSRVACLPGCGMGSGWRRRDSCAGARPVGVGSAPPGRRRPGGHGQQSHGDATQLGRAEITTAGPTVFHETSGALAGTNYGVRVEGGTSRAGLARPTGRNRRGPRVVSGGVEG